MEPRDVLHRRGEVGLAAEVDRVPRQGHGVLRVLDEGQLKGRRAVEKAEGEDEEQVRVSSHGCYATLVLLGWPSLLHYRQKLCFFLESSTSGTCYERQTTNVG